MRYEYEAAWVPFTTDRTIEDAAAVAMKWAEHAAAERGRPAVLVTDLLGEYHGRKLFDGYRRDGRHVSPRSTALAARPGAVIAHAPTPKALDLAMRLAHGTALAVVEHPAPRRLFGWARIVGARDLLTGEPAAALDPQLVERLEHLMFLGNNGYARGPGQTSARAVLRELHADGLLDRDLVVSALAGMGVSPRSQDVIAGTVLPPAP
ncbi:hypothetical protein [Micromonospora sp. NPDC048830]|uniref:hypothetical protein n=1 Tax=Micromonospora sp. NPDC048830 TaxID=3364257 RepID=UPI00371C9C4B